MWEPERSYQRILEDALADVPYRVAAGVISEKLAAQGIEMTERERERLIDHLQSPRGDQPFYSDDPRGEHVRIEITEADISLIEGRLDEFMTEDVPRVITSVGEDAAEQILLALHDGWNEEADGQRLERAGFEERLHERWGGAIGLLRMLLTVAREFADQVRAQPGSGDDGEMPVLVGILLRLHARACQVTDEIACLLAAGFSDGAMARWRTLHEIAAVALFLNQQGEAVAQRYVDHEVIEAARAARDYDECRERLGDEPMSDAELADIHEAHEKAVRDYGPRFDSPYGWAADALGLARPTLKDIRAAAGIDHMRPHYRLASHNVHANPKGVLFRLGLLGDVDVLLAGPSNAGLSDPGQNAAISLTQVCSALGTVHPTMDSIMVLHILNKLTREVCEAFSASSKQLDLDASAGANGDGGFTE
jgi:hypothetical protein